VSVFVLEEYDHEAELTSYRYDLELGYFTSREDAEEKIKELEADLYPKYEVYVESTNADNVRRQRQYSERLRRDEVLRAAGFDVPQPAMYQRAPCESKPITFDQWRRHQVTWSVEEIQPGKLA
jgi:hypothetical protein